MVASTFRKNPMKNLCDFIAHWMGAIVLLTALLSLAFPGVLGGVDMWMVSPLLGLIMFGMGLTLKPSDFRVLLSHPKHVFIGTLLQFIVMPLLAWLLTKVFALPEDLALGVILVGCCPGGTASNVITYLAKGDLALSVGITATSTLLAPLVTPALVWLMAGTFVNVDTMGMLLSIVYVVILPILAGFLVQHFFPQFTKEAATYLPAFSSLVIAGVVALIVSHTADKLLTCGVLVVTCVMLHNVMGFVVGYGAGLLLHLESKQRVAVSIEVGMQNSGLASTLAVTHFAAYPMAAIPGAVFSVWHNIGGAIAARVFASRLSDKEQPEV